MSDSESTRSSRGESDYSLEDYAEDDIFMPQYDETVEPEATPGEAREYREEIAEQESFYCVNCPVDTSSW